MDIWTSIAFPLVTLIVGYLLGILRDRNQFKANREARHQDETLQAAASLLDGARATARANQDLAYVVIALSPRHGGLPAVQMAYHESRRQQLFRDQDAARAIYQPAIMQLSILKPDREALASDVINRTQRSGATTDKWEAQAKAFEAAEQAFLAAVRLNLGVKRT